MVLKLIKYHLSKCGLKLPCLLSRSRWSFQAIWSLLFIAGRCLDDLEEDTAGLRKSFLHLFSLLPGSVVVSLTTSVSELALNASRQNCQWPVEDLYLASDCLLKVSWLSHGVQETCWLRWYWKWVVTWNGESWDSLKLEVRQEENELTCCSCSDFHTCTRPIH